MRGSFASPLDPFVVDESAAPGFFWKSTNGLSLRSQAIIAAQKTLVLIVAGQSNMANMMPTLFIPTNASAVDQFNINDGASYSIAGPLLGATYVPAYGPGCIAARVADALVGAGKFDRVIIVNVAVGGTAIAAWSTGTLANRGAVAMKRLASRGIKPTTPGVIFAFLWGQGESDNVAATSQSQYANALNGVVSSITAAGFVGRLFVCRETYVAGAVSTGVQAAQAGIINNTTIFSGGDLDQLGSAYRQADNLHFNDNGANLGAGVIINAMAASGAPF